MLRPAARISLPVDWQGTAEELAAVASAFLAECGFDAKFFCTERLVRYYLSRGVLTPPEKDPVDRRKALFGQLQFRQLILTRLLAERGWDLERVQGQLIGFKGPKPAGELDELLNQLAEPTQAEKLLFRSRRSDEAAVNESSAHPGRHGRAMGRGEAAEMDEASPLRSARRSNAPRLFVQAAKDDVTLRKLAIVVEKALADPDLQAEETRALRELAEMARLAFRTGGRKERWTRVRLAPWCEVNLRIGGDIDLSDEVKNHIINDFRRLMDDYDSRL